MSEILAVAAIAVVVAVGAWCVGYMGCGCACECQGHLVVVENDCWRCKIGGIMIGNASIREYTHMSIIIYE